MNLQKLLKNPGERKVRKEKRVKTVINNMKMDNLLIKLPKKSETPLVSMKPESIEEKIKELDEYISVNKASLEQLLKLMKTQNDIVLPVEENPEYREVSLVNMECNSLEYTKNADIQYNCPSIYNY